MSSTCLAPQCAKTAPRDYQRAATVLIQRAFRACRRAVYALPTGGGKTVIAVDVIQREVANGGTVLFLAHRREIINQTVERLIEAGLSPEAFGVVMAADQRANQGASIQVASVDTLRSRVLEGGEPTLVIIDEAHRALAASYRKILSRYPSARVLGLTATPYRSDGRGLRESFDTLVEGPTMQTLIAAGHLAAPRVWTVPDELLPNLEGIRSIGDDYEQKALGEAVNRKVLVGSIVEHWQRHAEGRRTVVFAVDVAHGRRICEEFTAVGIPAEHLDGKTKTAARDAILARLKRGETLVVTNCGVLTEGWDMREVKCGILARPTRSLVLYMQMVGRLLRPWMGVEPRVLDHAGIAMTFGLPAEKRALSLDATMTVQADGPKPCKTCPLCMEVVATVTATCACGHVFFVKVAEPEVLAGELQEPNRHPAYPLRAVACMVCGTMFMSATKTQNIRCKPCGKARTRAMNARTTDVDRLLYRRTEDLRAKRHLDRSRVEEVLGYWGLSPTPEEMTTCMRNLSAYWTWRDGGSAGTPPNTDWPSCGAGLWDILLGRSQARRQAYLDDLTEEDEAEDDRLMAKLGLELTPKGVAERAERAARRRAAAEVAS